MKLNQSRSSIRALALLLLASVLTTCGGDRGSGSNDERGVFGDVADALQKTESDFVLQYARIGQAVSALAPYLATALTDPSSPGELCGAVLEFDGQRYVVSPDSIAPDSVTRLYLYSTSADRGPDRDSTIAYIDADCSATTDPRFRLHLIGDPVTLGTVDLLPQVYGRQRLKSEIWTRDGLTRMSVRAEHGEFLKSISWSVDTGPPYVGRISGDYSEWSGLLNQQINAAAHLPNVRGDDLHVRLDLDSSGAVLMGSAYWVRTDSFFLASCIPAGSPSVPQFRSPAVGCENFADEIMEITPLQLQAMTESYVLLRHFWLTTFELVEAFGAYPQR